MSYETVADGHLAAVVTFLEMFEAPSEAPPTSLLSTRRIEQPEPDEYRVLFRLVGSPWLWFSRLIMKDEDLAAIIQHPQVEFYAVVDEVGGKAGILELDFREPGQCELAFIGLVPEL